MQVPGLYQMRSFAIVACMAMAEFSLYAPSQPQGRQSKPVTAEPVATLRTFSRMVTLEVVVKDSKGRHVTGLKQSDFRLFEQPLNQKKDRREQKIATFREVRMVDMENPPARNVQMPEGMYTNMVAAQSDPVPPTILLVDGLNTEVKDQAQVHVQMLRMLRQLPTNVPVAVFLFGDKLDMLQDFTTDPRLLQAALNQAVSNAGEGLARLDPRDDPMAPSAQMETLEHMSPELIEAAKEFEQKIYAGNMDMRVNRTIEALTSLGRHVSGYPGRKNLLWISTAFPIYLSPIGDNAPDAGDNQQNLSTPGGGSGMQGKPARSIDTDAGYRNYWPKLQKLNAVLSDAKIAVYPVNPAGVETQKVFDAETIRRIDPEADFTSPKNMTGTLTRDELAKAGQVDTMHTLAEGTGGRVCTGDNDLGDCVRKAVEDSSDFYEIAYYPDSTVWNGEFRQILVTTEEPAVRLSYRQGYFATPSAIDNPRLQMAELESACGDFLNATSVAFNAESLPPDAFGQPRYGLTINAGDLTQLPTSDGGVEMNVAVAVCTFNGKGWPLQVMSYPVTRKLDPGQARSLAATGNLTETIYVPGAKPAAVRLLVKDLATGRLGSIYIQSGQQAAANPASGGSQKQE